jgi:D-alanyl-D-alanine carboxypeptidase
LALLIGLIVPSHKALAAPGTRDCLEPVLTELAPRLLSGLGDETIFGLPAAEAQWVLYPVTQETALPASYAPGDLVCTSAGGPSPAGAQGIRRLVLPDLQAMFTAARADDVILGSYSGYRSYDTQAVVFEGGVRQQLARGAPDVATAEALAGRFRARPGHSQHQLGTTLDLTSPEVSNGLGSGFGGTRASQWVRDHGWEYGFVLPYSAQGEPRTGYAAEPWHVRWVGRELAAVLMADGYLDRAAPTADDYLVALDALLSGSLAACRQG